MHKKEIIYAGRDLQSASRVLVMVHGRGANAADILGLSDHLDVADFALVAPQATNHTWYPYSFISPVSANEPWLGSALSLLREIMDELVSQGIQRNNIYLLGFSQGACLVLEFVARNAARYGGVIAFTGGLIGEKINRENYRGDFNKTPVFIGSSDPDPHVPAQRVNDSAAILTELNAEVTRKIYKNMGHTINQDEIDEANKILH